MREQSKSSTGHSSRRAPRRRNETSSWSRSRQRAAYAASVDHLQGLMAWRIY